MDTMNASPGHASSAVADPHVHSHVFLGEGHDRNERRTWAVIALCGVMMAAEIVGGLLFGFGTAGDAGWLRDVAASLGISVVDIDGPVAVLELPSEAERSAAAADAVLRRAMERGRVREFHELVPQLADIYREVA